MEENNKKKNGVMNSAEEITSLAEYKIPVQGQQWDAVKEPRWAL